MQNSTNNQTTSDQTNNQNQITIISIILVIVGILAIIIAIIVKCIINKRRRLNNRIELRKFNRAYQIDTRIAEGGSNLRNKISLPQLPINYY